MYHIGDFLYWCAFHPYIYIRKFQKHIFLTKDFFLCAPRFLTASNSFGDNLTVQKVIKKCVRYSLCRRGKAAAVVVTAAASFSRHMKKTFHGNNLFIKQLRYHRHEEGDVLFNLVRNEIVAFFVEEYSSGAT